MKAFYFAAGDKKLRYGDGRKIRVGSTHTVEGDIKLCESGLHGSERLIDALRYAPGCQLYLVELSGDVDAGDDKIAASSRKYLAHLNAEKLLREFARKAALINIEKIKPYCSEDDYKLIVNYLKTGKSREAAYSAADSASWVAYSAADSAAYSAADSAAWAAYSAADSAAWTAYSAADSADSAADSAAHSAALPDLNKILTSMVKDATGWEI